MAYSELIKNFNKIRDYMREFYVHGFKSRDEFTGKSARSYDDERRRLESWLGDYMRFRQTPDGKNVFLSIDSRVSRHNPLFKAWKTKSFTDGDITLHFLIFDILSEPEISLTSGEIMEQIDDRLSQFSEPKMFDESTVRKKLKEYVTEGLLAVEKDGKTVCYRRAENSAMPDRNVLDFFSEVLPCGVIGSYLLDKAVEGTGSPGCQGDGFPDNLLPDEGGVWLQGKGGAWLPDEGGVWLQGKSWACLPGKGGVWLQGKGGAWLQGKGSSRPECFAFKHHYITGAMDSEVLYSIFRAIREHRSVTMETLNRRKEKISEAHVIPLKVMISVQNGRQYLIAYDLRFERINAFRTDNIVTVKPDGVSDRFEDLQNVLAGMLPHMWGVSTQGRSGRQMEHVDFTVRYADDEQHIRSRLEREKRCGTVEHLDGNTSRFSADVYDAGELVPWIRTFICRITEIHFSREELEKRFKDDISEMYELYGLGETAGAVTKE